MEVFLLHWWFFHLRIVFQSIFRPKKSILRLSDEVCKYKVITRGFPCQIYKITSNFFRWQKCYPKNVRGGGRRRRSYPLGKYWNNIQYFFVKSCNIFILPDYSLSSRVGKFSFILLYQDFARWNRHFSKSKIGSF